MDLWKWLLSFSFVAVILENSLFQSITSSIPDYNFSLFKVPVKIARTLTEVIREHSQMEVSCPSLLLSVVWNGKL